MRTAKLLLFAAIFAISSCAPQDGAVYIRVYNAHSSEFNTVNVDPSAGGEETVLFTNIPAGGYSDYVKVPGAKSYPIVDGTCLYATFSGGPSSATIDLEPGHYTYHIDLLPSDSMVHGIEISYTQE